MQCCNQALISILDIYFSKFYGKVGVISWSLFHLIWKNYVLYYTEILTRKVELWIFSNRFNCERTPQNNFSSQNFSVENNYFLSIAIDSYCMLAFFLILQFSIDRMTAVLLFSIVVLNFKRHQSFSCLIFSSCMESIFSTGYQAKKSILRI